MSYIRTKVRLFGLFFVVWPMRNRDASFFEDQNSREAVDVDALSNGRMSFFLLKEIAEGRFKAI